MTADTQKTDEMKKDSPNIKVSHYHPNILLMIPNDGETTLSEYKETKRLTNQIQRELRCSITYFSNFREKPSEHNLEVGEAQGYTYVFWIHGIADENITQGIDCFIGYGQPNDGENEEIRFTAEETTIQNLIKQFQDKGIKADKAPADNRYRAWKTTYMNKWLLIQGFALDKVQSIHLEFKKTGFCEKQKTNKVAKRIANAIAAIVQPEIKAPLTENKIADKTQEQTANLTSKMTEADQPEDAIDVNESESLSPVTKGEGAHQTPAPETMATKIQKNDETKTGNTDIELIAGHTNILLIAPHGHDKDDKNTGKLVRAIAEENDCYAIINETYRRADSVDVSSKDDKRVNVNHLGQVKTFLEKEFLAPLLDYKNEIVEQSGNLLIFWIHGAEDANVEGDISKKEGVNPKDVKVLVGWGQKKDDDRYTAKQETMNNLINALNKNGLNAVLANPDKKTNHKKGIRSYCGWDIKNMNQLFRFGAYKDYQDPNVQSFQLELRMTGCRDTDESLESTARNLAKAISALLQPAEKVTEPAVENELPVEKSLVHEKKTDPNDIKGTIPNDIKGTIDVGTTVYDPLVETAYKKLSNIFSKNYEQALMEAGQYLVRTFYGDEENVEDIDYNEYLVLGEEIIENARKKKSPREKTLHQLFQKLDKNKDSKSPSQAWIYNAVNLIIQHHDMAKLLKTRFYTYRNLFLSHKLRLLKVRDFTIKQTLIEEESQNPSTVKEFIQKIEKIAPPDLEKPLTLPSLLKRPEELIKEENAEKLSLEALKNTQARRLEKLKTIIDTQHQNIETEIEGLKQDLEKRRQFLEKYSRVKGSIEKAIEFKNSIQQNKKRRRSKSQRKERPN